MESLQYNFMRQGTSKDAIDGYQLEDPIWYRPVQALCMLPQFL
ncbi:hypothetical protein T09_14391 [Trichinella sp. T9]|nr:hypothetical protein T09_14391 [Trichinella sp. T9]